MNNIIFCRFNFYNNLRIIAPVDKGHHLNVLINLNIACDPNPHALFKTAEQAREKVLINLSAHMGWVTTKNLLLGLKEIINMKNTNTYPHKLAITATSLVMIYFASGIANIAQSAELVKAEQIVQTSLVAQAQANLMLSFATITIEYDSAQNNAEQMIAKKKLIANQNKSITLTKTTLMSD